MTKALDRPLYILAYAADNQGCGWHRISVPIGALMSAGLVEGRIDMQLTSEPMMAACKPDIIVWQRQIEQGQFEAMRRYRQVLPDAFFVYELDDHLGDVPEASYHSGFMPPNIAAAVAEGLSLCDAASTTTPVMAQWLTELGARDVRVIPNLVPMSQMRDREAKAGAKVRVGWGGGISHAGDLARIVPAIDDIGNEVEWVFLGMQPEGIPAGVRTEFHQGVPPHVYLEALGRLNLDLVLAPLEHNLFNRCKSNLRLIEAGTVCAAVIAEDIEPYRESDPPVFAHASTAAEWTDAIRRFIKLPVSVRQRHARAMQRWTSQHYTLESRIHDRLKAWLPRADQPYFRPQNAVTQRVPVVIACATGEAGFKRPHNLRNAKVVSGLLAAAREAVSLGADLLWVRPDTALDDASWDRLRAAFAKHDEPIAAAVPLATDGPNAFPRLSAYTPLDVATTQSISRICGDTLDPHTRYAVYTLAGPVVLLNKHALAMFGLPDPEGFAGHEEAALIEWGLRMLPKGWRLHQVPAAYAGSQTPPMPLDPVVARFEARGMRPIFQLPPDPLPADRREAMELRLLREQWSGPRPGMAGFANDYPTWALLKDALRSDNLVPAPEVPLQATKWWAGIVVHEIGDLSIPAGVKWLVFVDETVRLSSDALCRLHDAVEQAGPDVQVIYADHEIRFQDGSRVPDFKGEFDVDLLLARDYVTPVMAVRAAAVHRAAGQGAFIQTREDLYCLVVDIGRRASRPRDVVRHVPHILGVLTNTFSPEMLGVQTERRATRLAAQFPNAAFNANLLMPGSLSVRYDWRRVRQQAPRVSIIMPTKGSGWMLQPCLNTILKLTKYPNFEVLVVHNGEGDAPDLGRLALGDARVSWVPWKEPFNWSRLNNWAATQVHGEFLLFLNDDVRVGSPEWLDSMMGWAVRTNVGAVGARLVYPHGTIQHVGVVAHKGVIFHQHKGAPVNNSGFWGASTLSREVAAVTGACLLVKRVAYDVVGGFHEDLSHNYNDIAFCLDLGRAGLRNIVDNSVEMLHLEGASRPPANTLEGYLKLRSEGEIMGARYPEPDPFWSPNLALALAGGGVAVQGGNCDMLAWDMDGVKRPGATRVLLINDVADEDSRVLEHMRRGDVVFTGEIIGHVFRLTAPVPANVEGWDIRKPEAIAAALRALGIDEVVLCSLAGPGGAPAAPVETLRMLVRFGLPVSVSLRDQQALCPRLDGTQDGVDCGQGWKKGISHCQTCVNRYGSPFGALDVAAYLRAWAVVYGKTTDREAA